MQHSIEINHGGEVRWMTFDDERDLAGLCDAVAQHGYLRIEGDVIHNGRTLAGPRVYFQSYIVSIT